MESADVIVIGAGPAGSAAAIACAQAGLSVVVLEAAPFPRNRPGETLHPGVEPLLEQLGAWADMLSAGFPRHPGIWVGDDFQPYGGDHRGTWLGFQAWRAEFDALLLARARSLGVEVRQPRRAVALIHEGSRVQGVVTPAGELRARWTFDASGASHWLARQLGLPVRAVSPRLIAFYGYTQGECPARDAAPRFAQTPEGWIWTARVKENLYHWTRLDGRRTAPAEFAGLNPAGRARGADVTWRRVDACAGPGYFLLGDAASVLDPSSSHGVLRALMSGMLAGRLAADGWREDERLSTECYRRFLSDWFDSDAERLRQFRPGSLLR